MEASGRIRVGVNGYGAIGKRVADAVAVQRDMTLVGVADVAADWRLKVAEDKRITLFGGDADAVTSMRAAGLRPRGVLDDLVGDVDVVVDCTPKGVGARNAERYRETGVRFVVQGGEEHQVTGHSFVAEANYASAVARESTRVVSCNTTSIVRTLGALDGAGLLVRARGTLLRRATDPWESHLGGIMNTVVPEAEVPSHQAADARTVLPELDVATVAVKVPDTLGHVHVWTIDLTRAVTREEILAALDASGRIARVPGGEGLLALNAVKELASDLGRPRGDIYEVVVWDETTVVVGRELHLTYMVDNQAIVVPETVDAVRALSGRMEDAGRSMEATDEALGVRAGPWGRKAERTANTRRARNR